MRPKTLPHDRQVYEAYCRALRECESWTIPKAILLHELAICDIEDDVGFYILSQLNNFHNILRKEKQDKGKQPK